MARSIHRTRASLAREKSFDRPDAKKVERIERALDVKRRIKRLVRRERKGPAATSLPPTSPSAIDVRVAGRTKVEDFGVTEEDIRRVLGALSPGTLSGIAAIELRRGADEKLELVPGIRVNQVLGCYRTQTQRITLFAYERDAAVPEWETLLPWLKLRMLSTLVHEVGHHEDHSTRIARGRWRMDDRDKGEMYAERRQHALTNEVVLPYLSTRYRDAIRRMESWIEGAAGIRVPFDRFADDPRATTGKGFVRLLSPSSRWLGRLVSCLREQQPAAVVRREFADELHLADEYELALRGIRGALALSPDDADAIRIEACILSDLGRFDEAASRAERAVTLEPTNAKGLERLATIYQKLERWRESLDVLARALTVAAPVRLSGLRLDAARARLELGSLDGLVEQLSALTVDRNRRISEQAQGLKAIALLQSGRFEEAIVAAEPVARSKSYFRAVCQAAAIEAALRLGRPAPWRLDAEAVKRLRWWRFGSWIDRLQDEFPDAFLRTY